MKNKYWSECWDACQYATSEKEEVNNIIDIINYAILFNRNDASLVVDACSCFGHKELALKMFSEKGIKI